MHPRMYPQPRTGGTPDDLKNRHCKNVPFLGTMSVCGRGRRAGLDENVKVGVGILPSLGIVIAVEFCCSFALLLELPGSIGLIGGILARRWPPI